MPLVDHPTGNYRFLPGIAPYSCGVVSAPGHEIVHVTLHRPVPWREGFERIRAELDVEDRPLVALCAVELRSPRPFSFPGFAEFNAEYAKVLDEWGTFVNGVNPVARTNVAPETGGVTEPSLYGFSYSRPADEPTSVTFVVAGAGELPEGILEADAIVARGDTSPAGLVTKSRFVMNLMEDRLRGLGADWPLVTAIDIYSVHPIETLLAPVVLGRAGPAAIHGVRWFYTRPPIVGIEYEMDLRGIRTERRLES